MGWYSVLIGILSIITTYNDHHMTVTMMVTKIKTSVTLVHHYTQNMMMTMMMTVGIIKKNVAIITI